MTPGLDLYAFLRARLDEDEAETRETADADAEFWVAQFWADVKGDGTRIYRHDPARVIREVQAKRAILDLHVLAHNHRHDALCFTCTEGPWPCKTVRAIAAVYSDHPDYRKEWNGN